MIRIKGKTYRLQHQLQNHLIQPEPVPKAKQVTISVKGNEGYLLGAKKVDVQEGDTVYKVLQRTGLDVDAMGSKGVYVKGINDLYEKILPLLVDGNIV